MRKTCLQEIYALAQKDKRVVFVGSDLKHGTLDDFKRDYPDRFLMEGVSEQHIIGELAGLALSGKIPYFNTIAVFTYRRCLEQVIIDVAMPKLPVRFIASGGGLVYAPLGLTHVAVDDLAIVRTIPNMTIVAPADATEMQRLMPQTLDWPGPLYIRLAKGGDPVVTRQDLPFRIGQAIVMAEGSDAVLFTTGITLHLALEAREVLKRDGIDAAVVHVHTVKPLDTETVLSVVEKVSTVVTLEEGTIAGGLGSSIAEVIAEAHFSKSKGFVRLGLPDLFTEKYGSQKEQMEYYGLNTYTVVARVRQLIYGKTYCPCHTIA